MLFGSYSQEVNTKIENEADNSKINEILSRYNLNKKVTNEEIKNYINSDARDVIDNINSVQLAYEFTKAIKPQFKAREINESHQEIINDMMALKNSLVKLKQKAAKTLLTLALELFKFETFLIDEINKME